MANEGRQYVEEYWSGVTRRLQEEVETLNGLIAHHGEKGRENELSLTRLMTSLLPRSVGVGSGLLIDAAGNSSRQLDLLIQDVINQPALLAQTTQVLYPVEGVHLAVEVKTTLDPEELADCRLKQQSVAALQPSGSAERPAFAVLAYSMQGTPRTMARKTLDIPETERPDLLCVLSPGLLAAANQVVPNQGGHTYSVALLPLHALDAQGARQTGDWQRPHPGETGAYTLRQGRRYPLTRTGNKEKDRILGDPGRALLLFCNAVLQLLASRQVIPSSVMSADLSGVAHERFDLTV